MTLMNRTDQSHQGLRFQQTAAGWTVIGRMDEHHFSLCCYTDQLLINSVEFISVFSITICCPGILSIHISQLVRLQHKNLFPDIVCNFCQLQDYSGQVKLRSGPEFHSGSLHQSLVFNSVSLGHERSNELPSSVPKS